MFYTMGEVSEMFDVSRSLIRYWEKHFDVIKPVRNKKGNRLFTPKDVENFKLIYHLVKERGMTLEGAKKSLRGGKITTNREVELMDRLLNMRSLLLEVREVLKEDGEQEPQVAASAEPIEPTAPSLDDAFAEVVVTTTTAEPFITDDSQNSPLIPKRTKPTGESSDEKELFAFYEQNLF